MKKIVLFFVFFTNLTFGQNSNSQIDNYAKSVKYNGDISKLVLDLTKDCNTEIQKSRAIYIWIIDNISYDYKTFNKKKKIKIFKCKSKEECELKQAEWKEKSINKVLKKKKGICSGYSELYKKMCSIAGVRCDVIEGYIKTEPFQIGRMGVLDHAWNVLIIDNNYYYLDLTWSSGFCTKNKKNKLNKFIKKRNEYYWLTPIDKLSRNHFPKDTLQLVNSKYNKAIFKKNPYIQNSILPEIEIISPNLGIINAKIGDTILFKFNFKNSIDKLQINTNVARNPKVWKVINKMEVIDENIFKKQKYVEYKKDGDVYSFNYIIDSKSVRFIEILFNKSY
jgi:Transglutaminase-like superfamily